MTLFRVMFGAGAVTAGVAAVFGAVSGCSSKSGGSGTSAAPVCSFNSPVPGQLTTPSLSLGVDAASLVFATTWAVVGPQDDHCAATDDAAAQVQTTSPGSCCADDAAIVAASEEDSGPPFGLTMWNSTGSDDDCKYNVQWRSTEIDENKNVWFQISVQSRVDDAAVSGAYPHLEVVQPQASAAQADVESETTPCVETAPGQYIAGPVQFTTPSVFTDAGGGQLNDLYVRFHFFEWCMDVLPDSPHGHSAFYLNIQH